LKRTARWIGFLAVVVVGLALGLVYGWLINPTTYTDTEPSSLRADYRADWVLMTAAIYSQDGDLAAARARLDALGEGKALRHVQEAILASQELGYLRADLDLLAALAGALGTEP